MRTRRKPAPLSSPPNTRFGIILRTSDRVVHVADRDVLADWDDARTRCGRAVHFCDLAHCRCLGRHVGRSWSARVEAAITCLECCASVTEAE